MSKKFKKDYKKLLRSGRFDDSLLNKVINTLAGGAALEEKYRDHALKGSMKNYRECHLKPDLLLIYKIHNKVLVLELMRLGSHSEVFN